jgi:hypothetical protein
MDFRYKDIQTNNSNISGLFGAKPLIAFTSEESHYSIKKVNFIELCFKMGINIYSDW